MLSQSQSNRIKRTVTSEVIPDINLKSRDSGIPTKINPGIPENREKFPGFPKIGNFPGFPENRDSRKLKKEGSNP